MAGRRRRAWAAPPSTGSFRALPPLLSLVLLLARAPLPSAAPVLQAAALVEEAALMQRVRELVHAAGLRMPHMVEGWAPADPAPHCRWQQVVCDDGGRVAHLYLWDKAFVAPQAAAPPPGDAAARRVAVEELLVLLPGLQRLADLEVGPGLEPLPAGCLPPEWLAPGAFPRLHRLSISSRCLPGPLADIPAGALPALAALLLVLSGEGLQPVRLPPSWGASPAVLPALRSLLVTLPHGASVELPPGWSRGFPALERLDMQGKPAPPPRRLEGHREGQAAIPARQEEEEGREQEEGEEPGREQAQGRKQEGAGGPPPASPLDGAKRAAEVAASDPPPPARGSAAAGGPSLPGEWASGFPRLTELVIAQLPLPGTLPQAWVDGGFPALRSLTLSALGLTGTLPPRLFERHPQLVELQLGGQGLSGSLPPEWAPSQMRALYLHGNQLTGPAFPPAWLAPGALADLRALLLGGNRGLGGELPQALPWTKLQELDLFGTGVQGSVPAAWCKAPFARIFFSRWVLHPGDGGPLEIPPCAADVVPATGQGPPPNSTRLPAWGVGDAAAGGGTAAAAGGDSGAARLALLVGLATVLPLAVAAAAGAAGRALWLRRARRAQAAQHERDRESLLRRGRGSDARGGGGGGGGGRWARLAALVRSTLGSGREGIEMLPHATVPSALVHQLGARRGRGGGGGGGGLPTAPNVSAASSWADGGADLAGRQADGQRPPSAAGGSSGGSAGNSAASRGGGGAGLHSAASRGSGGSGSRSGSLLAGGAQPPTPLQGPALDV